MQKPMMIYIIALALGFHSLVTIKHSFANGALVQIIFAFIPLIGSIGLINRKAWSRYFIYSFTIISFCWWMAHTIWLTSNKGWPYYPTPGQPIVELVRVIALYLFLILGSLFIRDFFKMNNDENP